MSIARLMQMGAAGKTREGWDISTATFNGANYNAFNFSNQDATPGGVFFKPDGTKLYMVGQSNDSVYEYNLGTAWQINTASYVQSFSVTSVETAPTAVFFKSDGTKMYVLGYAGDTVREYDLGTAWDISTASLNQSLSVGARDAAPRGLFFKPDGTKMYVLGDVGNNVYQYDLSTAWDISTASYIQAFSVTAEEATPFSLFFKSDGTTMYVLGQSGDDVNEYSLSTAWDVSTAAYVRNFSVGFQDNFPSGLFFKDDGTVMYVVGYEADNIYQYSLSTAWNVSTASWSPPTTQYFSVSAQETSPLSLFIKPDGTKFYILGTVGDDVNEYDLSTAWDITTASYVQNFSVNSQDTSPASLFFKEDGTSMFVVGYTNDNVYQYSLSTAWDISTASYVQSYSVATQELTPQGLFFKPDGLKMYIVGTAGDEVNEYSLSTAWDISTASYVQTFSVASEDSNPVGLFFKPDGTKMYISGVTNDKVYEYALSTAWDISTASLSQSKPVYAQCRAPQSVFFKPDGLKMYIIDSISDAIWAYDL